MDLQRYNSSTSKLLEKVNAQLKGNVRNNSNSGSKSNDLNVYLNNLNTNVKRKPDVDNISDLSDVSIESLDESSLKSVKHNKFIKSKITAKNVNNDKDDKPILKTVLNNHISSQKSSALVKASSYIKSVHQNKHDKSTNSVDSDIDIDLSLDEEVMADVNRLKKHKSKLSNQSMKSVSFKSRSTSDSSLSESHKGRKFLKKKSETQKDQSKDIKGRKYIESSDKEVGQMAEIKSDSVATATVISSSNPSYSQVKVISSSNPSYSQVKDMQTIIDSDESSESQIKRISITDSLEEDIDTEDFKINVLDLDELDLIPVRGPVEKRDLDPIEKREVPSRLVSFDESLEIISEAIDKPVSHRKHISESSKVHSSIATSVSFEKNDSDIKTEIDESFKSSKDKRNSLTSEHISTKFDVSSDDASYTDDFPTQSAITQGNKHDSTSDSFDSETSASADDQSNSSDTTYSESITDTSNSYSRSNKVKSKKAHITKNKKIQTSNTNYDMIDTFIYSNCENNSRQMFHPVFNADVIDAIGEYSPGIVALNEMLKSQISLTENFIKTQQYHYQLLLDIERPAHGYTTLKETKDYIKKNKKSTISYEKALKKTKKEMGILT